MATLIEISDPSDPRLDAYRELSNRERPARAGRFVAESAPVIQELVSSARYPVESVLLTPRRLENATWVAQLPAETTVYVASDNLLQAVAGFPVHRGCLALGIRSAAPAIEQVLRSDMLTVVVLDGVADPDNVGSIFRSGFALGADAVLLGATCADPLYRKAIRTSMGTVFRLPHAGFHSTPDAVQALRDRNFRVAALTPRASAQPLADFAATLGDRTPVALLVGNEGLGLGDEALQAADVSVRIPMRGDADSLNVHVATAVALAQLGRVAW